MRGRLLADVVLCLLIGFCACGGGGGGTQNAGQPAAPPTSQPSAPTLTSISVGPNPATALVGATVQFTATGIYSDNSRKDVSASTTWSSSAPTIATVNSAGLGTAKASGTTNIMAAVGSVTGSATLTVSMPASRIEISAPSTLLVKTPQPLTATLVAGDGSRSDVSAAVTWQASSPIVRFTTPGAGAGRSFGASGGTGTTVTGQNVGQTTITATLPGVPPMSSTISVTAIPRFLYQPGTAMDTLSIFTVDPHTSQLRNWGVRFMGTNSFPIDAVNHPWLPVLYVLLSGDRRVAVFSIAADGTLSESSALSTATGESPIAMAMDAGGKFLYVANRGTSNNISAFTIDPNTGALSSVPGSPYPTGAEARAITISPDVRFLFVTSRTDSAVYVYTIDAATGALSAPQTQPTGAEPVAVAVHPTGRFVYVSSSAVYGYSVNHSTGQLTPVPGSPFGPGGLSGPGIAIDATGTLLYVSDQPALAIRSYRIDPDTGALAPVTDSPFPAGNGVNRVFFDPANSHLYASCWGEQTLRAYDVNRESGALQEISRVPTQWGSVGVGMAVGFSDTGVHHRPKYAYVGSSSNGTITAFAVDADTGALTDLATPTQIAPSTSLSSLAADAYSRRLYAATSSTSRVNAFTIEAGTGKLTALGSEVAAGPNPQSLIVDATGRFAIVADLGGEMASIPLDPDSGAMGDPMFWALPEFGSPRAVVSDGAGKFLFLANSSKASVTAMDFHYDWSIVAITGTPFAMAGNPTALVVDPSRSFLYALDGSSGDIYGFAIDGNGVIPGLNPLSVGPFASGPSSTAISIGRTGRFLYVLNTSPNRIFAYGIDAANGALTPVAGSPFVISGTGGQALVMDASSQFLYVANQDSNDITILKVDASTGVLNETFASPTAAGDKPRAIVLTETVQ